MLASFSTGQFQGTDPATGETRDWKSWDGKGRGYEGFLVDNYFTLAAVCEEHNYKRMP